MMSVVKAAPSAVVFDNDGLLLDTEEAWTRAEQRLFERLGGAGVPLAVASNSEREFVERTLSSAGRSASPRPQRPACS